MRHSLIYNYLREHAVLMLQNAYKHPCSKHLTTNGKGTHFFQNRDKKTNINASEQSISLKKASNFGQKCKNSMLFLVCSEKNI